MKLGQSEKLSRYADALVGIRDDATRNKKIDAIRSWANFSRIFSEVSWQPLVFEFLRRIWSRSNPHSSKFYKDKISEKEIAFLVELSKTCTFKLNRLDTINALIKFNIFPDFDIFPGYWEELRVKIYFALWNILFNHEEDKKVLNVFNEIVIFSRGFLARIWALKTDPNEPDSFGLDLEVLESELKFPLSLDEKQMRIDIHNKSMITIIFATLDHIETIVADNPDLCEVDGDHINIFPGKDD